MFPRTFSASSLSSEEKRKVIKLVKNPIHIDFIKIHVKCGDKDLAYLVMQSEDGSLTFYAKGMHHKIQSPVLYQLFDNVGSGWSRLATEEDYACMRDACAVLSSFLPVVEKNIEECAPDMLP